MVTLTFGYSLCTAIAMTCAVLCRTLNSCGLSSFLGSLTCSKSTWLSAATLALHRSVARRSGGTNPRRSVLRNMVTDGQSATKASAHRPQPLSFSICSLALSSSPFSFVAARFQSSSAFISTEERACLFSWKVVKFPWIEREKKSILRLHFLFRLAPAPLRDLGGG